MLFRSQIGAFASAAFLALFYVPNPFDGTEKAETKNVITAVVKTAGRWVEGFLSSFRADVEKQRQEEAKRNPPPRQGPPEYKVEVTVGGSPAVLVTPKQ